jgi:hypothetical protein
MFVPYSVVVMHAVRIPPPSLDYGVLGMTALWVVSGLLVLCCDVTLMIDGWKLRRAPKVVEQRSLGVGDWLLWLVALGLSVWWLTACAGLVSSYPRGGSPGLLVMILLWSAFITIFDVAVAVDAVKMWRAHSTQKK